MSGGEIAWRARNAAIQRAWAKRAGEAWPVPDVKPEWAGKCLRVPRRELAGIQEIVTAAEAVVAGCCTVFGTPAFLDAKNPDWFRDPATGRYAPSEAYSFRIAYRDQGRVGNVKYVWELSRLHSVTLLAAAYYCTGRPEFADCAIAHLQSWWRLNPPLRGIHWVSGIELGLRLIAWVWARRLLEGHRGLEANFEGSRLFHQQLHAHQSWIATFFSRGSSANNHLVAEMAGLLAAARAFPLFAESGGWANLAAHILEQEVERQTFPDGLNRELASDYHVFALELFLIAGIEADASGVPMSERYWLKLRDMADALAGTLDVRLETARQGDSDNGRALVVEPASPSSAIATLRICGAVLGPASWWPKLSTNSLSARLLASLPESRDLTKGRASRRPNHFPQAGTWILRDPEPGHDEIWCRFDAGPHGFLSTAAHAHADSLSFELRVGGRPLLVDCGTYCYHGEGPWRDYFRSTIAHNTLELNGRDQADAGGPFLWLTQPRTTLAKSSGLDDGEFATVQASHDGYRRQGAIHHRKVVLDRRARTLELSDWIEGDAPLAGRLAFNLHPDVSCELGETEARLGYRTGLPPLTAVLELPSELNWRAHRGQTNPILGWYSPVFGQKTPSILLIGSGKIAPGTLLRTRISLGDDRRPA
ncbi:MAG: alginate lyase family protein [Acetobacteraceae bacterium]|nr:alginate lyase family protein [Acetobacteraceae bacterium]